MKTISFSKAQNSFKSVLDYVVNNAEPLAITRAGEADVVVMSLHEYSSLMETVHLLRSPANAEHLNRSIAQYKEGNVSPRELIND
jgi:antitoxin YefM